VETYASIIATKMFSNRDPGYVDLTSPAGIGLGALVYNYDGACCLPNSAITAA
jgi:uncharacterized protein